MMSQQIKSRSQINISSMVSHPTYLGHKSLIMSHPTKVEDKSIMMTHHTKMCFHKIAETKKPKKPKNLTHVQI